MSDIFICYSKADRAIASRLEQRLRDEGWSVFMDVQTHVGKRWHKEIERELHAARAVVVLWSARSRESDFVLEEAEYERHKEILFPAFIERVEFPYGFGRIQAADLIGWAGDTDHPSLAELLESLEENLNSRETTPGTGDVIHADAVVTSKRLQPAARVLASGQTFRDRLTSGADGPFMVVIPAGRFLMGSMADEPERLNWEGPQHDVRIAAPFAMGVFAVTFENYDRCCDDTKLGKPEDQGWGRGRRPVINVSWEEARDYCAWLTEQTGRNYRLPSEAEWEYACRAGTAAPFHFGARITTEKANFNGNHTYNGSAEGSYRKMTLPVGSFPPNAFGLYDMHGNVWEWCEDAWHDSYTGAPTNGSAWEGGKVGLLAGLLGAKAKGSRVLRGGSWYFAPRYCRAASRYGYPLGLRGRYVGFRVCCGAPVE